MPDASTPSDRRWTLGRLAMPDSATPPDCRPPCLMSRRRWTSGRLALATRRALVARARWRSLALAARARSRALAARARGRMEGDERLVGYRVRWVVCWF
jgi:hypothetical protein